MILDSLRWLSNHQKVNVYAFSIMPTHIHLIWQLTAQNGKESPKASFMKFTAHSLRKYLVAENRLHLYQVSLSNKRHEIWQPDALGIEIYSRKVARQKLEYIHRNSVAGKWRLVKDDISYHYSSALFYETGEDRFGFLRNIFTVFDGR